MIGEKKFLTETKTLKLIIFVMYLLRNKGQRCIEQYFDKIVYNEI